MTEEKVLALKDKYAKSVSSNDLQFLSEKWKLLDDEDYREFINIKQKRKSIAVLLALFFGGIGAERYYIGPGMLGCLMLAFNIFINELFLSFTILVLLGIVKSQIVLILIIAVNIVLTVVRVLQVVYAYIDCKIENYNSIVRVYNNIVRKKYSV